jgi:hypothetical protein
MAQVTDIAGVTHLNGTSMETLCGEFSADIDKRVEGVLTCPECAKRALNAIQLSTKSERKEWRKL